MTSTSMRPAVAAAFGAALLTTGAFADDAGERAFANELRILPAFSAHLVHTVTRAYETRRETAQLDMDPARASFRLRFETLPMDVWRVGGRMLAVPSRPGKPTREQAVSAGKLAGLLFLVGSRLTAENLDVTLERKDSQVQYTLLPRTEGSPIAWICFVFDDVGLQRAAVLEHGGDLHRIVLLRREVHRTVATDDVPARPAPTVAT